MEIVQPHILLLLYRCCMCPGICLRILLSYKNVIMNSRFTAIVQQFVYIVPLTGDVMVYVVPLTGDVMVYVVPLTGAVMVYVVPLTGDVMVYVVPLTGDGPSQCRVSDVYSRIHRDQPDTGAALAQCNLWPRGHKLCQRTDLRRLPAPREV